jgi:hypothetical protein
MLDASLRAAGEGRTMEKLRARILPIRSSAAIVSFFYLTAIASADVKVTVSFDEVWDVVSPSVHQSRERKSRIIIIGKDHTSRTDSEYSDIVLHGSNVLGKPSFAINRSGVRYVVRHSIENGAYVIASFLDTYRIITRIKTDGTKYCSATRDYKLNRGNVLFEDVNHLTHAPMFASSIKAENITCAISEVEN